MAIRDSDYTGPTNEGMAVVTWTGLLNGDTGKAVALARFPDKTVQIVGTFGVGGTVNIEGSNDGGTTWGGLHDPQGVAIAIQDSEPIFIAESPLLIRPNASAGDGTTDVDTIIAAVAER